MMLSEIEMNEGIINQVSTSLSGTGVVTGEYGFVKAYQRKIDNIKDWLSDSNISVSEFAYNYIKYLERRIEHETSRADERTALEKHKHGIEDED